MSVGRDSSEREAADDSSSPPAGAESRNPIDLYLPGTKADECDPDLALARQVLSDYQPADAEQCEERERFLQFVRDHPSDAHERSNPVGHLTASTLLLDARGERALLMLHRKLGRWLQFGGHCDGDANLRAVALKETAEESGILPMAITHSPIDLDVHAIPARGSELVHFHWDVRFLAWAPVSAREIANEESCDLRWFRADELSSIEVDVSLQRLLLLGFAAAPPIVDSTRVSARSVMP
ncbi:MAG: 8-oxo-dGTP pyrophosphatase MutT (NUDIX family) [Planctomycetota bacterium]|jgi:8-oxo-dGTP pyrophosphatase MutT (NUDIX family)